MIELGPADFVPLEQFKRAWRFTDAGHNVLPPDALADIRPLMPSRAAALNRPLTSACEGYYSDTVKAAVEFNGACSSADAAELTRRDLAALPVADHERLVVSWDAVDAAETSWLTFRTYWDAFCYPSSDDVTVYPLDGRWVFVLPSFRVVLVRYRSVRGLTCVGATGRSAGSAPAAPRFVGFAPQLKLRR